MTLCHRSTLGLIGAIVILSLLLRYPATPHEVGIDSFVFHGLAVSLTSHGYASWILTPASYVGLYPLSEPSGSVFLLASLHFLSSFPIEGSILLLDMITSIVGTLGAFLLAREFNRHDRFSLLAAFLFATAPEFVVSLDWQIPTRIGFTALIPFLLWTMLRVARRPSASGWLVLVAITLLMMSFHRLTVLMAALAVAYLATLIVLATLRMVRSTAPRVFLSTRFRRGGSWLALGAIAASSLLMFGATGVLNEYEVGEVASGTSLGVEVLNLVVSLTRSSGFLLPLALVGAIVLVRRRAKGFGEPFMVIALIAFIPTLFLRQYTGFYTIPLTTIFVVAGLDLLIEHAKPHKVRLAAIATVVVFVLVSTNAIVGYDLSRDSYMTQSQFSLGLFARYSSNRGAWIFNDGLDGARVASVAGKPYLPVGGATTAFQGPELLIYGFVNPNSLTFRFLPLSDITIESDSVYVVLGVQAEGDWATLLTSSPDGLPLNLVRHYDPQYLAANRAFPTQFYAYGNLYNSPLLESAQVTRYVVYEDQAALVWRL